MKATIDWTGDVSFKATSASGHSVQLDGPADLGARIAARDQWKWY